MLHKIMPQSTRRRGRNTLGTASIGQRIYSLANAGLWAFAVAAGLWGIALLPHFAGTRHDAELDRARSLADESRAYCEKWGMAAGTPRHDACLLDLTYIRESTRRDMVEAESGLF